MIASKSPVVNAVYARARAVRDIVDTMITDEDNDAGRMWNAMDLVLLGKVDLNQLTVESGQVVYHIDPETGCTCQDKQFRDVVCKHMLAIEIATRAKKEGHIMPKSVATDEAVENLFGLESSDPVEPPPGEAVEQPAQPNHFKDYPSTLCIKRMVGMTELMWTFRGTEDADVWQRATEMIRIVDHAASRYTPPAQPAPVQPAPTAEGAPWCEKHGIYFKQNSNAKGTWWSHKAADGSWCRP